MDDKLTEILQAFDVACADTSAPFDEVVKQAHSAILDLFKELLPDRKDWSGPTWNDCLIEILANIEGIRRK